MEIPYGYLAACVFVGFSTEAVVGFGGLSITLALAALFAPLPEVLPHVVLLSLVLTSIVVARSARQVAWSLFLRRIVPAMALGFAGGWAASTVVPARAIQLVFGMVIVVMGVRGLRSGRTKPSSPRVPDLALLLGAGALHGTCALGGPVVAYTLARRDMDKGSYRATMALMFLTFSVCLTVACVLSGRLGEDAGGVFALNLPVLLAAVIAGSVAHRRISQELFRRLLHALLVVAGAIAALRALC